MATATTSAGSYQTGFFSTPGDLKTAAQQVNSNATALQSAIDDSAGSAPASWTNGWASWKSSWDTFYTANFGASSSTTWEWLTSDLAGQLETFEAAMASWASQAASYGISGIGPVPSAPSDDPLGFLPSAGAVLGALALTAVIVIAWKVF